MSTITQAWDSLTAQQMRERGSLKWTRWPGTIGAWVAEMDLGIAPEVAEAIKQAVDLGELGYMPDGLLTECERALAAYSRRNYGWDLDPDKIFVVHDVIMALRRILTDFCDKSKPVIVPTPAYMTFLRTIPACGFQAVQVPSIYAEGTWQLDFEGIEAAMSRGASLFILCNPWNPVGRVLTEAELDKVAQLSAKYGVPVFNDEIHAPLLLSPEAKHHPYPLRAAADPDLTWTATSASKGWNVPALGAAQLILDGKVRQAWRPIADDVAHHAGPLGVRAATAAFNQAQYWVREVSSYVHENAQLVSQELAKVGLDMDVPQGTYLGWVDCSSLLERGVKGSPTTWLRENAGVALTDGADCGHGYEHFARLNMATGHAIERQTVEQITAAVNKLN